MHLHVIAPDGVFVRDGRRVRFVPVTPDRAMLEAVVERTRKSMLRWLGKKGYLAARESNQTQEPDGLLACQQIALQYGQLVGLPPSRAKSGPGRLDTKRRGSRHHRTDDGFDLDANVAIDAGDDQGRERVVRYCARPAIALEHLSKLPDGRYSYRTKYARQGRSHRVMTGAELMARIAALVPPPRFPLLRYSGVFSAAHSWRRLIVPGPTERCKHVRDETAEQSHTPSPTPPPQYQDDSDPSAEPSELRSPFILTDEHLRRLLDGALVMNKSRATWVRCFCAEVMGWMCSIAPSATAASSSSASSKTRPRPVDFSGHLGRPSDPPALAPARDPTLDQVA